MPTITFLAQVHTSSAVADYLNRPDNQIYLANAIVAHESCKEKITDTLQPLTPKELSDFFQSERDPAIKALYPVLQSHPALYHIDNIFGADVTKSLLLDIFSSERDFEPAKKLFYRIPFARDLVMAKNLLKLLEQQKNIIVIIGSIHLAIVYHLLALLPEEFKHTELKIIDLSGAEDAFIQHMQQLCKSFYFAKFPVFSVRDSASARLPALEALTHIPNPVIHPERLALFKSRYQQALEQYKIFNRVFLEVCMSFNTYFMTEQGPALLLGRAKLNELMGVATPNYEDNLLGKELIM